MKKLFVLGALGIFALSSCKKDYTCECTSTGYKQDFPYEDYKKKDANEACDTQETFLKEQISTSIVCTLK